jgi:hypothetical protein
MAKATGMVCTNPNPNPKHPQTMIPHRISQLFLPLAFLLICQTCFASQVTFFVALDGKDENSGTLEKPFATLERARDAARQLKPYPEEGVAVRVRGGIYEREKTFVLGAEDSGLPGAPVVYGAFEGEQVTLLGGKLLPSAAFKPARREFVDQLADESAKRHVLELDLKALGITDYGSLHEQHVVDFGSPSAYIPAPMELFIDGKAMTLARWPNSNPARPLASLVQTGKMLLTDDEKSGQKLCSGLQFKGVKIVNTDGDDMGLDPLLVADRLNRWKNLDFIPEGFLAGGLMRGYAHTTRRLAALDAEAGTVRFATPVLFHSKYEHPTVGNFFFRNIPQEIDQPGEYYIDRQNGVLFLYPPVGFSAESQVAVSMLEDVLVAIEGASHTRLEGLTLEGTRSTAVFIADGDDNIALNCVIRNIGLLGVQIGMGYDAKAQKLIPRVPGSLRHALCTGMERLALTDLETWGHPRSGTALEVRAGHDNGVVGCRIYDTGAGGVIVGGGDRKSLTSANNFVRDCEIFRTDRLNMFYAEAVLVHGVGNRVTGNYLHDSQGGILYIHGNDHLIEFNEITRAIQTSRDCGAVEIRQNPSQLGNRIAHNYFHDLGRPGFNPPINCIYLDNSASGVEITGNVFARIATRSVAPFRRVVIFVNCGYAHTVTNNLFLDNTGVLLEDGEELAAARRTYTARRFMMETDVDVMQEPYLSRYPEFAKIYSGIMAGDEGTKLHSRVFNNVLIGNGSDFGPGRYPEDNHRRDNLCIEPGENPGFLDEASGDYTFRPDSMVFKRLPTFQAIPFDKMRQAQKWREQTDQKIKTRYTNAR